MSTGVSDLGRSLTRTGRRILGAIALLAGTLIVASVITTTTAVGQTPNGYPCGRVTAYTGPTANSAGSITIGTSRFALASGSVDREIAVGSDICIDGPRDAAGAYTRVTVRPMAEGTCGTVTSYTPASPTNPGSITLASTAGTFTLPVAPGVLLTSDQIAGGQCFTVGVNAEGNAQVVRHSGRWEGASAPTPTARQLPSTSVAIAASAPGTAVATAGVIPTTEAADASSRAPLAIAAVAIAALLAVALTVARRRIT